MENTVTIEKAKLQQLLDNFYDVCGLADECNISEFTEGDEAMQEMKSWVNSNFGRKIK